jgi:hypothetical protein
MTRSRKELFTTKTEMTSVTFLKLETFSDELIWPDSKVIYPTEWSSCLKIVKLEKMSRLSMCISSASQWLGVQGSFPANFPVLNDHRKDGAETKNICG